MNLKEAIESGKPFRREGKNIYYEWLKVEGNNIHYANNNQRVCIPMSIDDLVAIDYVLKYDCEECKDTKQLSVKSPGGVFVFAPCHKCSVTPLPKYKCETCKDTKKVWYKPRIGSIEEENHWVPCSDCSTTKKEPVWVARYLEEVLMQYDGKIYYGAYVFNPDGSKTTSGGVYEYCVPFPKLPKVKLK